MPGIYILIISSFIMIVRWSQENPNLNFENSSPWPDIFFQASLSNIKAEKMRTLDERWKWTVAKLI